MLHPVFRKRRHSISRPSCGKISRLSGSFTVEASLLMGLVLFVLLGILYLFFHVHNRAWLTCAACEAAICGSMAEAVEPSTGYAAASLRAQGLMSTGFFAGQNLRLSVSENPFLQPTLQVSYSMDTRSAFGRFFWHMDASGTVNLLHPVKWIRQLQAVSGLV